ncbi:hypothetical protein ACJA23_01415 [Mycoplasma corogypsi]|uniref:hypothetical protein n=1 Tax=Mycoplasma corogypsi TaxID=2106 RepID=UPI003872AD75
MKKDWELRLKNKYKILFIDGESLFNQVYTTYIQNNLLNNKDFNQFDPETGEIGDILVKNLDKLFNLFFMIISRSQNLDLFHNFTNGTPPEEISEFQNTNEKNSNFIKKTPNKIHEPFNSLYREIEQIVRKNIDESEEDQVKINLNLSKLLANIGEYVEKLHANLYNDFSQIFIAFNWTTKAENHEILNQNIRNIILNEMNKANYFDVFNKNILCDFSKSFTKDKNKVISDANNESILYCDTLTHLRINSSKKFSQYNYVIDQDKTNNRQRYLYDNIRKHFINLLKYFGFNLISIPYFESLDTISSYISIMKSDNPILKR